MRFRFVAAERASFPVRTPCRAVGASASGSSSSRAQPTSPNFDAPV